MATPSRPPQTIAFVPQGSNQARGSRSLPLGSLVEATNVRQVKEDEWRKRRGFGRFTAGASGGSYGNASQGESVYAGALVERDLAGQFWSYPDTSTNTRQYRGVYGSGSGVRPFPSYQDAGIDQSPPSPVTSGGTINERGNRRSVAVLGASGDRWVFTVGHNQFQYTVTASDGSVRKSATTQASTSAQTLAAAYHPGQGRVYVIVVDGGGTLATCYSFNASTYALAGSAAYAAGMVGSYCVDMRYLSTPAEVAVIITQYDNVTPRCRVTQSYLDPATLLPKAAPAAVNFDVTPNANRTNFCGGARILISSGATSWYYSVWRASSTSNVMELMLVQVTTSSLATAANNQLATIATTAASNWRAVSSGWLDTVTGNRRVLAQTFNPDRITVRTYDEDVRLYTWNGAVVSSSLVGPGAWLASSPCLVGTEWYFLTGRDTGATNEIASQVIERAGELYLRDSSGNIVAQMFGGGDGPAYWHRPVYTPNGVSPLTIGGYDAFTTTLVSPSATELLFAVGRNADAFFNQTPTVVKLNFAASYSGPVALGRLAIFPGPILSAAGPDDWAGELFPLHPPPKPTVSFGSAGLTGAASVCATYRIVRSDGRAWESSPSPAVPGTYFFSDNSVSVPTYKHRLGSSLQVQVCIYATQIGGTIFTLQEARRNDPTVNSISGQAWAIESFPSAVSLHTNGGGLSNATPPPCRTIALWRDRLHLSGTPTEGEVWHSQEIVEGLAPTFNEVLRSFWQDAQGPILGLKAVDWNYLAGFKRNGIGVIGGPGPDGRGQGAYVWQTLTTEKGLKDEALNSLLSTPYGCAFQNEADGRICLVSTGLQVQDIMQGADSHRSLTVGATLLNESERQAWFYCTDGTLLVLEYAWAGEAKRLVECWRKWSSANLLRAYGAVMMPTGPLHIEQDGSIRLQSANWVDSGAVSPVDVLMALETNRLAPFGLMQEGGVVQAHILGQHIAATTLTISVTCDDGTTSSHPKTTSSPVDYSCRPTGGFRCKEVRVRVEETASGNEGFVFEGVALDVVPYGRTRILPVSGRIA